MVPGRRRPRRRGGPRGGMSFRYGHGRVVAAPPDPRVDRRNPGAIVTKSTRLPVLVTGHRGYIGSVMVRHLLEAGYDVVGMDIGYFDDCTFVPDPVDVPTIEKDIRDVVPEDLRSLYAVIHLAALSNDPIGNLDSRWPEQINLRASVRLAELARAAGVRRFLFSSSCIMYGVAQADVATEESPLNPQTTYARSKVRA